MLLVRVQSVAPKFIPGLCNGSTTDFDSVSLGSIPSPGANIISVKCYLVASAIWGRVV